MSSIRPLSSLSSTLLRPFLRTAPRASLPISSHRFASGDYGSGTGDPVGEKPQDQGASPSSDLEHPGPPPPKAGQGSGSTPTKGTSSGHNTDDSTKGAPSPASTNPQSGNETSGKAHDTGNDISGGEKSGSQVGAQGAQPKILHENPPPESKADESVKKHNEDFENRAEKAHEKVRDEDVEKDKVNPKFWSGHGGADRDA